MSLLNEASFLVTPNGYKEDKLYAAIPTNGNGDMTVTRTGTATRVNEAGLVELVPYNLLSRSQEFNTSWSASLAATITPNATTAPDGTMTADSITTTPGALSYFSQSTTQPAGTYTLSFFVKPQLGIGRIHLEIFTSNPGTHYFNLDLGVVVGSGDSTFTITPYPNGWYRCTATRTFASSISGTGAIYLATYGSSATLTTIFFWGAQLVEGSSAKTYQKTVDRLDIPRIDYTGGGCPSILLEPLRTNLALYSENFEGTNWGVGNIVVTQNDSIAPSGEQTAVKFQRTSTSGGYRSHTIYKSTSAITYATSVFVKQGEDNFFAMRSQGLYPSRVDIRFRFDTGLIYHAQATSGFTLIDYGVENYSNGWYRIYYTYTTDTNTYLNLYCSPRETDGNIDGTDTSSNSFVYLWGVQIEAAANPNPAAFPTSYIPTTTATVTRIADVINRDDIYTSNLITDLGGTWFVDLINNVSVLRDTGNVGLFIGNSSDGLSGDMLAIRNNSANRLSINKRIAGSQTSLYPTTTETVKIAIKWNGATADVFVNGAKVVNGTVFTTVEMEFFRWTGGDVSKYIKQMALFPTPLHEDECKALTTL